MSRSFSSRPVTDIAWRCGPLRTGTVSRPARKDNQDESFGARYLLLVADSVKSSFL